MILLPHFRETCTVIEVCFAGVLICSIKLKDEHGAVSKSFAINMYNTSFQNISVNQSLHLKKLLYTLLDFTRIFNLGSLSTMVLK